MQRYIESYWSTLPGLWVHGDFAMRGEDGLYYILGRSDDTIKISGKRTGPAELEGMLIATGKLAEAAVFGIPHPGQGLGHRLRLRADAGRRLAIASLADELSSAIVQRHGHIVPPRNDPVRRRPAAHAQHEDHAPGAARGVRKQGSRRPLGARQSRSGRSSAREARGESDEAANRPCESCTRQIGQSCGKHRLALLEMRRQPLARLGAGEAEHLQRCRRIEQRSVDAQPVVQRIFGPADRALRAGRQILGGLQRDLLQFGVLDAQRDQANPLGFGLPTAACTSADSILPWRVRTAAAR